MIPDIWLRGKLEAVFLPLVIVLVAGAAFGLGRLSALQEAHAGLIIHYPGEASSTAAVLQ